jgi:hypothetical protein
LEKQFKDLNYYFYNIPFCIFKNFWRKFIDTHCIRNRLCIYYNWYINYWKCNKCRYWLFCNNFNKKILKKEIDYLDWFYEEIIYKDVLLEKVKLFYNYFIDLWFKRDQFYCSTSQKYISDLLVWKIDYISVKFLDYLTLYFNFNNEEKLFHFFEWESKSMSLVCKNDLNDKQIQEVIKKTWININISYWKNIEKKIDKYIYKWDYFLYGYDLNWREWDFFDFEKEDLLVDNKKCTIFKGKTYNSSDVTEEILRNKVKIVKKARDIILKDSDIYIWRDLLSWVKLKNYKWLLLSSDNLGEKGRFFRSKSLVEVPVIYDIKPDITKYLNDGDVIDIDFSKWVIKKI